MKSTKYADEVFMTDVPSGENRSTNMWEELNRPKNHSVEPEEHEDERDDKAAVPLAGIIGGAVAIAAVAFAGFVVMGGGDDVVEAEQAATQSEPLALQNADGASDGDSANNVDPGISADVSSDDDGSADAPTSDEADDEIPGNEVGDASGEPEADGSGDAHSPAVPLGAEGNYAVLSRGKLYLRGDIPTPLISIGAVNALEEIMGEGNVISEFVVDPDAVFEMGAATDVFIEDTVLFGFGSAEIAPDFYPLLGLGSVLMQLQDGVTIEIYGHTDSAGSDEANLALSQARVDAVEAFWVSQGAGADRITAIGKGETEPIADNSTPEGQQLNRRVEIVITGFVFSL